MLRPTQKNRLNQKFNVHKKRLNQIWNVDRNDLKDKIINTYNPKFLQLYDIDPYNTFHNGTRINILRINYILSQPQTQNDLYDYWIFIRTDVIFTKPVILERYCDDKKMSFINSNTVGGGTAYLRRDWDYCWIGTKSVTKKFTELYCQFGSKIFKEHVYLQADLDEVFTSLVRK